MVTKRTAFFVSDGTGLTAEGLGNSLLTQFEHIDFKRITIPYINSPEKALKVVQQVAQAKIQDNARPIIFDTIVKPDVRAVMSQCDGLTIDIFGTFLTPLEQEFGEQSTHRVGRQRTIDENVKYPVRIEAMNYALDNDDGAVTRDYNQADIILVGVSRSGKTPTCLYLALQFGIKAANYPITDDDLDENQLPKVLRPYKQKIYGLTIDPVRLQTIRQERKPDSRYSSARQCQTEVRGVESLLRRTGIPFIDSTHYSVEEIATHILSDMGLQRQF